MSLYKLTRENQHFFINTGEIFGVQNVDAEFTNPTTTLEFIGMSNGSLIPDGPRNGSFDVSQFLITDDTFLQYTGDIGFSGYLLKSRTDFTQNYSFTSGYLTSYRVRCGVGTIPEIGATIESFGKVGNIPTGEVPIEIQSSSEDFDFKVADPGSVTINMDEFNTNRCSSFEISISCPRQPYYMLGQYQPKQIESRYPFPVTVNFQLEVDDYSGQNNFDYPCSKDVRDLSITLKDLETQSTLLTYSFSNMTKVSESVVSEVGNNVAVALSYQGYIGR